MHGERDGNIAQLPYHKHERKRRNSIGSVSSESKSSEYHGSRRGRSNAVQRADMPNGSRKGNVLTSQNTVRSRSSEVSIVFGYQDLTLSQLKARYWKDCGYHRAECTPILDDTPRIPPSQMGQGMFNGSQNMIFNGGIFTNVILVYEHRGLKLLEKRVAHSAFHNSAQRIDPPRCHPKTRKEVLDNMLEWIMRSERRDEWILWLNGAAGAGKSAIVQTLAERCVAALMAVASFFFFRSDSTRNSISRLVATLAYQLIQAIPEVSGDIQHIVEENPLIFDQDVESQLQQLIIQPYLRLPAHLRRPFVVFIDGLDECLDHIQQTTLIKVFGDISQNHEVSIICLIASRRERQIEAAFGKEHVSDNLRIIPLDELSEEQTSSDIHSYLTDKFDEIKKTHPRKQDLPLNWPHKSSIEGIVKKSSGQFIYAFIVMNFVSTAHTLPLTQLLIIDNIRPRDPTDNPFANLDALYEYIFSKVKHLDFVKSILTMMLIKWDIFGIARPTKIKEYEALFSLQAGDLESLLANLSAVIHCVPNTTTEFKFLHASLGDFLLDPSRSGEYYINSTEQESQLLCIFFESYIPDTQFYDNVGKWRIHAINELLSNAKVTASLQSSILNFQLQNPLPWGSGILYYATLVTAVKHIIMSSTSSPPISRRQISLQLILIIHFLKNL
ncbi:hypothetical protein BDN70DRAFT_998562 [Pholiota conissans]|uniref:Nephrocystin 3-like N-terminal domain-containing protein n=1 Tax=Pholiota conissans TaxID=109636 RepID=A0A9P6CTI8_9AGAR|nr:hypothetical protein BDN70DRAFT_998562 [Pholiota conissans]